MRKATINNAFIDEMILEWRDNQRPEPLERLFLYVKPIIESQISNFQKKTSLRAGPLVRGACFSYSWDIFLLAVRNYRVKSNTFNAYFRKCLYFEWFKREQGGRLYSMCNWSEDEYANAPYVQDNETIDTREILADSLVIRMDEWVDDDIIFDLLGVDSDRWKEIARFIILHREESKIHKLVSDQFDITDMPRIKAYTDVVHEIIEHILIEDAIPNANMNTCHFSTVISKAEGLLCNNVAAKETDYIHFLLAAHMVASGCDKALIGRITKKNITQKQLDKYLKEVNLDGR